MTVEVTQYLRPDGRQELMHTDISDDCRGAYIAMQERGWRLAAENLTTGEISLTVEDLLCGMDVEIEVVPNGPEVPLAIERILKRSMIDREDAAQLLAVVQYLQEIFWDKLGELERALGGIEINSTQDLEGITIDDLLELAVPEEAEPVHDPEDILFPDANPHDDYDLIAKDAKLEKDEEDRPTRSDDEENGDGR